MPMKDLIVQVNVEQIYQHILAIEGPKHPILTPEKLEETADYIEDQFEKFGLTTNSQEFKVETYDGIFRNIEGYFGNGSDPELLIVGHYDTVEDCPGANDNGSALGILLEVARVLGGTNWDGNVRFIAFSLEEASNPTRVLKSRLLARNLGLIDPLNRYTSWHTAKIMMDYRRLFARFLMQGNSHPAAIDKALVELRDQLTKEQRQYFTGLQDIYHDLTRTNWPGKTALFGSSHWVSQAQKEQKKVLGVLCLETVGYTSNGPHSQKFPRGLVPELFNIYGTDETLTVGDFLAVIGDQNSGALADSFCNQCRLEAIQLPYACLQGAFSFEQAAQIMPDILRSDHAPFWRVNIPGLMLTDSANFRYPFFHTPADTIDKLDFDFITKICKATIATTIDLSKAKT
jgi:Zn-dependent M28 family amino/carboxypeptidase